MSASVSFAPDDRPLYLPVLLGTTRRGRLSAHAARFVTDQLAKRSGVETELVDLLDLELPFDDAGEEAKSPAFAYRMDRMDGLVVVAPEYNHSFPNLSLAGEFLLKDLVLFAASLAVVGLAASQPPLAAR